MCWNCTEMQADQAGYCLPYAISHDTNGIVSWET